MRRYSIILILLLSAPTFSQTLQDVLKVEKNTREALNQYAFKRDVLFQELNADGQVTGEYTRKSEFVFDDHGQRIERNIQKRSTLTQVRITDEDIEDFAGVQLLGIDDPDRYHLELSGDSVSVRPRPETKGRYFTGDIEFHPVSLQVTKARGRAEPNPGEHRFPFFTVERGNVGAPYWFPISTAADDVLHFPKKDVRVRIKTRYYEYRKFRSSVTLTEIDVPAAVEAKGAHWPIGSQVKVYLTDGFSLVDKKALQRAINTWNALVVPEIQFISSGEVTAPQMCLLCLTVTPKKLKAHAGLIQGHSLDGLLKFAWIEIDEKNVESVMLHELGHSLGLGHIQGKGVMTRRIHKVLKPSQEEVQTVRRALKL